MIDKNRKAKERKKKKIEKRKGREKLNQGEGEVIQR